MSVKRNTKRVFETNCTNGLIPSDSTIYIEEESQVRLEVRKWCPFLVRSNECSADKKMKCIYKEEVWR
jgi:hypothetical protein